MSSVRYCSCTQFENSDVSDVSVVRQEVSPFNEHSESYNNHQEHDQYLMTEGCEVFRSCCVCNLWPGDGYLCVCKPKRNSSLL